MSVSGQEQDKIQEQIDNASPELLATMRAYAEGRIAEVKLLSSEKTLSAKERKVGSMAIETLVRLDATELGKGPVYRIKRRFQLTNIMFLTE